MVPVVLVGMLWFIVPLYRKVIGLSTYEYFEKRFSPFARFYSSLGFVLTHFSKMGTVFFLLAFDAQGSPLPEWVKGGKTASEDSRHVAPSSSDSKNTS